jgi:hypothetical protein
MQKLSSAEFADALKKGKGRAFMQVRDRGDTGIESELLHACLHSLAYDTQCEGDRGSWMMDLIECIKSPDLYYQSIVSSFIATTEFWDVSQLSTMLTLLAKRNYPGARDLLYRKFGLQEFRESSTIGADLIELDGIEGMLHVAETIGKRIQSDSDYWENNYLTSWVCELLGKEETAEALQEAAKSNPSIKAYIDNIIATSGCLFLSDEERKPSSVSKETVSLQEFLSEIEKAPKRAAKGYCLRFGRNATSVDTKKLIAYLANEQDREKSLRCLWVFRIAELPEVPDFMLAYAVSADDELRSAALTALANTESAVVREFALELLNDGKLEAIELFKKNYADGDLQRIMQKLHTNDSDDKIHSFSVDILQICGNQNSPEAVDCLLWLYENTPCAMCRNDAISNLIAIKKLPLAVAMECMWDCYEDTRKEVAAFIAN